MALPKIEPICPNSQKLASLALKSLKMRSENIMILIRFTTTYLNHWVYTAIDVRCEVSRAMRMRRPEQACLTTMWLGLAPSWWLVFRLQRMKLIYVVSDMK